VGRKAVNVAERNGLIDVEDKVGFVWTFESLRLQFPRMLMTQTWQF